MHEGEVGNEALIKQIKKDLGWIIPNFDKIWEKEKETSNIDDDVLLNLKSGDIDELKHCSQGSKLTTFRAMVYSYMEGVRSLKDADSLKSGEDPSLDDRYQAKTSGESYQKQASKLSQQNLGDYIKVAKRARDLEIDINGKKKNELIALILEKLLVRFSDEIDVGDIDISDATIDALSDINSVLSNIEPDVFDLGYVEGKIDQLNIINALMPEVTAIVEDILDIKETERSDNQHDFIKEIDALGRNLVNLKDYLEDQLEELRSSQGQEAEIVLQKIEEALAA